MKKQGGFIMIFILALIGAGFFYGGESVNSSNGNIIISQIMVGQTGAANNEFIELYNSTGQDINLSGFSLKKKTQTGTESNLISSSKFIGIIPSYGFFLISHPNYQTIVNADLVYSGASYYISANNTVLLYDTGGNLLDKVGWGTAGDFETQAATEPDNGKSIARKITDGIMQDADNNAGDFEIKDSPLPRNASSAKLMPVDGQNNGENNNATTTPPVTDNTTATSTNEAENLSGFSLPAGQKNNFGDILINELVSDPADNEVEWIEIYNKANREINLTGWWIEEGSKAKTVLNGSLGVNGVDRYKIIDKPAGSLNNGGDIVILYDERGKMIDQIVYGNWDDGDMGNNAPTASDPNSLARKFDGYNTYNNFNDFAVTLTTTKGISNIIQIEDEVSPEAKAKFDFSDNIFISEILPNPAGDDTKLEFIEIYNAGKREINLTGWSLSNEDNKKINLEKIATSTIIKAGEYLAFFRPRSKIVLHNDQGQIKLFQPLADKPFIILDYKNVKEGWSYNLVDYKITGELVWSETSTPGAVNIFKTANHPPEVEFSSPKETLAGAPIVFDSSDTYDQEEDKLKYAWDFGDGFKNNLTNPEHTYLKVGIYKIKLEVSDGQATGTREKNIRVVNSLNKIADTSEIDALSAAPTNDKIIINEIFPNPDGADTGQEWVELKNQSANEINLLSWRIENSNGKYEFKNDRLLNAGDFYILDNAISKLAFKNTSDVIILYNGFDEPADQVEYIGAVQGETYARGANGNWFWTTKTTPGEENIISFSGSKSEIVTVASLIAGDADGYIETTLEKIKELGVGSLVIVKGTVAVPPGILGVQIFYIVGSPGMQIYNYKKDFPALHVGDYIEVTGELTEAQGEFRIKTKDKSSIKIVERKQPPLALAIKSEEVNEENIGQLITVTGDITDKKSTSLYVDDGSGEIFVYIKQSTGIDTKSLTAGQKVLVTGVLSKTQTGLRLLPRYQDDIVLINSETELEPQVLGEVISEQEWDLAERDKKLELFKYLLIIAGGVIIVLAGLFIRAKRMV